MLQQRQTLDKEDNEKLAIHIEQVQNPGDTPFYVIKNLGRTNFLIKHKGSKYKVAIGERNECSCSSVIKQKVNCIHIVFILLRVYGMETDSTLLKKVGFSEYELRNILKGKKCYYEKRKQYFTNDDQTTPSSLGSSSNGEEPETQKKKGPRPIEEGDCCPICMDEISEKDIDVSLVCCRYSCGNYIHATCLREYFTNSYQKHNPCPFCRFDWKSDLDNQMIDLKQKKMKKRAESVTQFRCSECHSQLEPRKKIYVCHFCYKCRNAVVPFCDNCYKSKDVHVQHKGKYFVTKIGTAKKIDHELLREEEVTDRQVDIMPFANSNEGVGSVSPSTCQIHSFSKALSLATVGPQQFQSKQEMQSTTLGRLSKHHSTINFSSKEKQHSTQNSEDLNSMLSINTFADQPKSPRRQHGSGNLKRGFTCQPQPRLRADNSNQAITTTGTINLESLLTITNPSSKSPRRK